CDPAGRYLIFEQFPRDERAKTRPDRQYIVDRQRSDERARDGEHGSDEKRDSSATARQPRHDREIAKPDDDARHHVDGVVDAEHEAGETHYYDGDPGDDRTTSPGSDFGHRGETHPKDRREQCVTAREAVAVRGCRPDVRILE